MWSSRFSLHEFVYLKYFWTQLETVHLHGPCSLRPCSSRPYFIPKSRNDLNPFIKLNPLCIGTLVNWAWNNLPLISFPQETIKADKRLANPLFSVKRFISYAIWEVFPQSSLFNAIHTIYCSNSGFRALFHSLARSTHWLLRTLIYTRVSTLGLLLSILIQLILESSCLMPCLSTH